MPNTLSQMATDKHVMYAGACSPPLGRHLVTKKHSGRKICDLNRAQLCKLLASDKLLVTSEATVYKAVFQWVNANPAERSQYWEDLLDHVYFTLMSRDEVENCLQNSLVKKNLNIVNKIKEAIEYLERPTDQKIDYWLVI